MLGSLGLQDCSHTPVTGLAGWMNWLKEGKISNLQRTVVLFLRLRSSNGRNQGFVPSLELQPEFILAERQYGELFYQGECFGFIAMGGDYRLQ